LLATLDPEALNDLQQRSQRRRFPRGATLMLEGDTGRSAFLMLEGRVKVSSVSIDGREVLLNVHGPGELVGLVSAIDGEPRSGTVTCLEPCEALVVDGDALRAFVDAHPAAAYELLRAMCRIFRYTNRRQIDLSSLDVLGRVAAQLVDLANRFGAPEVHGVRIDLPVTHEQLAAAVGTSREAVGKALQRLQALDLVSHRRRELTVLDVERLAEHAQ
jgi:CRP-like cAMP-binding protein